MPFGVGILFATEESSSKKETVQGVCDDPHRFGTAVPKKKKSPRDAIPLPLHSTHRSSRAGHHDARHEHRQGNDRAEKGARGCDIEVVFAVLGEGQQRRDRSEQTSLQKEKKIHNERRWFLGFMGVWEGFRGLRRSWLLAFA